MENKTPFMTEIPEQEPQRQQYFMAHAKEQLHILEENLGRPLTCCINTFGCQMNARDSEKSVRYLRDHWLPGSRNRGCRLCSL